MAAHTEPTRNPPAPKIKEEVSIVNMRINVGKRQLYPDGNVPFPG